MPMKQDWYIDGRVALVRFWGDVSVDDVVEALDVSAQLVKEGEYPKVHFLHDWSRINKFPTNILQIRRDSKAQLDDEEKLGWMVVFGMENRVLRFISQVVLQVFNIPFRMFSTQEEAREFLKDIDPTLPDIPPVPAH